MKPQQVEPWPGCICGAGVRIDCPAPQHGYRPVTADTGSSRELRDGLAETIGCAPLADSGGAVWCETHGEDWPCRVGRVLALPEIAALIGLREVAQEIAADRVHDARWLLRRLRATLDGRPTE